jgi:hypothetical protein
MMRFLLAALLIVHGVAHLVGFAVPWRLVASPDVAYRTTILAGTIDVGDTGARVLGILWLLVASGLVLLGSVLFSGVGVRAAVLPLLGFSLLLCFVGWPDARIGVVVNIVLLGVMLAVRHLGDVAP